MTIEQAEVWKLGLGIATVCAVAVSAITASLLPFFEKRFKKFFVISDIGHGVVIACITRSDAVGGSHCR
jgi:hypothetical protein